MPKEKPKYIPWWDCWSGKVDRSHAVLSPERRRQIEIKLRRRRSSRIEKLQPLSTARLRLSNCSWQAVPAQYRAGIAYTFNPEDAYFLSKLPLPTEAVMLGNDPLWSLSLFGLCESLGTYISKIPQQRRRFKVRELADLVLSGTAASVSELSAKLQMSERWIQNELVKIKELLISEKFKKNLRK